MSNPVGMTGTQEGLTRVQKEVAEFLLEFLSISSLHHGDCIGADEALDEIARQKIIHRTIHPPINASKRAFCGKKDPTFLKFLPKFTELPTKEYLDRNHDIVDDSELLLAFSKGMSEEQRSGTWATVRYAEKVGKPIIIVFPDGSMVLK